MTDPAPEDLRTAWKSSTLSLTELWLRYFALGGTSSAMQVDAFMHGAHVPDPADCNQLVLALNERFTELGSAQRVAYSTE